jgi:hypothetical protein
VANADKAFGKHMQQEAAQELIEDRVINFCSLL